MKLEFNWKYKDYELRAVPKYLARFNEEEENVTIDFLKWYDDEDGRYCFSLGYWKRTKDEGYCFKMVGDRMFRFVEGEDLKVIWEMLRMAQCTLDDYDASLPEE